MPRRDRTPSDRPQGSREEPAGGRKLAGVDRHPSTADTARQSWRRLACTIAWVFVAEVAIMWVLGLTDIGSRLPDWEFPLLDGAALTLAVAPLIYFVLHLPLRRSIEEQRDTARSLRDLTGQLEARVEQRTSELTLASADLEAEIRRCQEVSRDLAESERKYVTLVENSLTGIFVYQDGRLVFANRQFADILGYSPDELRRIEPEELVDPGERSRVLELGRKRLAGEPVSSVYETRMLTKAGDRIWVEVRAAPVLFAGRPAGLVNVLDITERKRAMEELRESQEELRRLSSLILTAQEEERFRVAHELHDTVTQSLCGIKFYCESRLFGDGDGEGQQRGALLRSIVSRLQSCIENVRAISHALLPSSLEELGLTETVSAECRQFRSAHPEVELETRILCRNEDIPASIRLPLFRIIQGALANVARHSGARHATVTLTAGAQWAELIVSDDGQGFDVESVKRGKGRSFGLGVMRERAEFSGGDLRVSSAKGSGTIVWASWPVCRGPASG